MDLFHILTPSIYWLLAIIWFAILVFSLSRYRSPRLQEGVFRTLFIVLIIEASRTLFESVFFGALRTSEAGLLSAGIAERLIQPHWIFAPKAVNLLAGIAVIVLLLKRFSPQELAFGESQQQRIVQLEESLRSMREAQTRLRGSEEHYAIVVRLTGQLVYDYDIVTGGIVWKGALTQITGYPEEAFSGFDIGRWEEHIHPGDRKTATELLTRSMAAAASYQVAYRFRRADGGYRWIEDCGAFVTDAAGRPVRMLGTMKDIDLQKRAEAELVGYKDRLEDLVARRTEALEVSNQKLAAEIEQRARTETALRQSEQRFRTIFRQAPMGITIAGPDGRIMEANDYLLRALDYTAEEIQALSIIDIAHPEERPSAEALVETVRSEASDLYEMEMRYLKNGGDILWGRMRASAVRDEDGAIRRWIGIIEDVTEKKEAREMIEAERRFLRQVIDAVPALICVKKADGRFDLGNLALARAYGTTVGELEDRTLADFSPAYEETGQFLRDDQEVIKSGRTKRIEEETVTFADGSLHWLTTHKIPLPGPDGTCTQVLVVALDITKRVRAEAALRDSEALFRTAFRTHPDSININRLKDGVYIDVNDGFTQLTGYSRHEAIGKSSLGIDIWHDPQDRERLVRELAAGGRVNNLEAKFRLKDGRIGTGLISAALLQLHGEPHILSVTRNIEERKQIENRLRKFEHIVSASKDLMALINLDYVYEAVNAAYSEYHGRGGEEIVGRSIPELVGQAVFEEKIRPRIDRVREGQTVHYQDGFHFPGQGWCFMDTTYFPVLGADGRVEAVALISRDITATRRLEKQLADAQKMDSIGTLAGGIAHDFNNILGVIIGQAELMDLFYAKESPRIRNSLAELLKAAGRAKDLVAQIMTFSRRTDRERMPVDVVALVKETLRFLRSSLPATIEIKSDIRTSGCRILANPIDIHQILMNLGTNASHAMGASGGVLEVRLDQVRLDADTAREFVGLEAGAHLRIAVSDTGCGIAPEIRDRIFEPYFTTKEVGKGTGLGLSVIHGIVKSLSGHISVYSEPGRGTTFKLMLPCCEKIGAENDAPADDGPIPTGSERILLVDDEPLNLETTGAALEGLGYRVTVAGSGAEALERFQTVRPAFDLVVTDMTMPKMTGFELARRLLEIRTDLPVILCTGFSETLTRQQALGAGIRRYLEKPLPIQDLAVAVRQVLDGADATRPGDGPPEFS